MKYERCTSPRAVKTYDVTLIGNNSLFSLVLAKILTDKGLRVGVIKSGNPTDGFSNLISSHLGGDILASCGLDVMSGTKDANERTRVLLNSFAQGELDFFSDGYKVSDLGVCSDGGHELGMNFKRSANLSKSELLIKKKYSPDTWLANVQVPVDVKLFIIKSKFIILTSPSGVFSGIDVKKETGVVKYSTKKRNFHLTLDAKIQFNKMTPNDVLMEYMQEFLSEIKNIHKVVSV
ncbi:hypothetical protein [Vibrio crassostreae]|uniref:hypothetical protein n=1 Tax=Vibrio crassostreae TaxID=246167 RepID=UPI001B30B05C|nr:hypothetical protein [Vibrio crassostreae]